VRFARGGLAAEFAAIRTFEDGVEVIYQAPSKDVLIVSIGSMATVAMKVAQLLADQGIGATVVDPGWVIPVPQTVINLAKDHRLVVTIEDGIKVGGVGTRIRQDLREAQIDTALTEIGLPDEFLDHATRQQIFDSVGLDPQTIARDVIAQVLGARIPHAKPVDDVVMGNLKAIQPD